MPYRILIVDDDPHIGDVITFALQKAGMTTTIATDGAAALAAYESEDPDLVILDIGLPEVDGLEVCRQIRKRAETPILFVSARDEEIDRVLGLEMGGDDYVTKPFSPRELVARVHVILKRVDRASTGAPQTEILEHGPVSLDRRRRVVTWDKQEVTLTALEFEILSCLLESPGFVLKRSDLMATAYPDNIHVSDRTIDSHIRNIRAKFSALGCQSIIETVHGVGFRIGACAPA